MPAFALTIFTGAFLLFQVQPLVGKYILPWFGGGPGVWTTCMLFFQLLLLGGYAYAHVVSRHLKPRPQALLHVVLLAAALASLPITPGDHWKPTAGGEPAWQILALLTASLGLPYFVLSATGPLMQEWFRRTAPGVSPYRLYALSNVGSLLALISYPFYFETNFTRLAQARFWSWGLVCYALCCGYCAWRVWRQPLDGPGALGLSNAPTAAGTPESSGASAPPTAKRRALWLVLPACASVLLLAVTNKICQDVAVIPFLWVLPLALYLLTFIICFDHPRWYSRFWFTLLLVVALAAACHALFEGADLPIVRQVAIYAVALFVGCMICHGELYRLKPHPAHLTSFYLLIAAGGAAGGLFVALVAPAVFDNFYELHLSLALLVALLLALLWRGKDTLSPGRWRALTALLGLAATYGADRVLDLGVAWALRRGFLAYATAERFWNSSRLAGLHWTLWVLVGLLVAGAVYLRRRRAPPDWHRLACGLLTAGWCALVVVLGAQIREASGHVLLSSRNFYGVLSVLEYEKGDARSHYYLLQHGRITHGIQFSAPERAGMITSYFGLRSGLGLALRQFPRQDQQRIGLLGLGVGTITAYGKPGDYIRLYEIDPAVTRIAAKPFSYLARSQARIEVVMGDGRLSMEREPPQNLDFLIMDAFSSDAVPVHLLTKEAFAIYQRHLKPDGAILVNISNRYLNLRPVIENAARALNFQSHHIECEDGVGGDDDEDSAWWLYGNTWMVLSKNTEFMSRSALTSAASPPAKPNTIPLWTDDYSSLFRVLQ
jgi:hypothetical protein